MAIADALLAQYAITAVFYSIFSFLLGFCIGYKQGEDDNDKFATG